MSSFRRKLVKSNPELPKVEKCTAWWDAVLNQGTHHSPVTSNWIPAIGDKVLDLASTATGARWEHNCLTVDTATSGEYGYYRKESMYRGTGDFTSVAIIDISSIPVSQAFGYVVGETWNSGSGLQRWEVSNIGTSFRFSQVVTSSGWEHFFSIDVQRSIGFMVFALVKRNGALSMYVNGEKMKLTALKNKENLISDTEYLYSTSLSPASGSYASILGQVWYKDAKRYAKMEYIGYGFDEKDASQLYEWAKWYYLERDITIPDSSAPKFTVTTDIASYEDRTYRNVYDSTSGKWYELNDSDEYEEYGVVEIVQSLDETTKYLGKKVLTMDSHLYEWNGKIWIDYGVSTRENPTKQYIVLPVPENNKVFASKADMEAYDRPWVGMIAYVGSDEYRYNESFKWQSTASWVEVETGQWIESTKTVNGYAVYMSNSNKGVASQWSWVRVRWSGIPDFKMYLGSYAEGSFDYSIAYALDANPQTTQLLNTSGFQKDPSAGISSFRECSYPNDGGEHFAWVAYRKDGSVNSNDDRGYLAIPNEYL